MLTDEMKAQGWVEHDGGPCPVDGDQEVSVMFRDGKVRRSGAKLWSSGGTDWWKHEETVDRPETDIIAYKPEQPNG